jgi:hypothetical protein
MRNRLRTAPSIIVGLTIVIFGVIFAYRHAIIDAYRAWQRGPIPTATSRQDFLASTNQAVPETPSEEPEPETVAPTTPEVTPTPEPVPPAKPEPKPQPVETTLPAEINLKVPFILQAPFQVWDEVHEDACEEASVSMIKGYLDGDVSYTKEQMEQRIQEIVDYEDKTFGTNKDSDAVRTATFLSILYGIKGVEVVEPGSIEDIKREVAAGRPVIIPAYGKALHNPNFKNGGPVYHNLVIKGYTSAGKIITNDPGTRNGPDYVYDADVLWNAIHDFNDGDVPNGRRVMIVVR